MQTGGLMSGFYNISVWISRFVYVNLLWGLFTFVGLVIFGFFPATAAMFAVTRKWVMGETDVPVFKTYWKSYKTEFLKSNILGIILVVIGYILFIDIRFFQSTDIGILQILYIPLLIVTFVFSLALLYVFPIFVHYDIKLHLVLKNSFFLMIMNPLSTMMMIAGLIIIYYMMMLVPGLILFFTGSTVAFVLMFSAYRAISKVEQRQQKLEEGKKENEEENEKENEEGIEEKTAK